MTVRLPADLLRRSADEGPRLVALAYLDEIVSAERRLADPQELEALHDFRVGLRRLRSCLRAYRSQLDGSVPKKMRRRLRELTLATNPIRDAEVQLAWLQRQAGRLQTGETEGMAWLVGRLEGRKYEALERGSGEAAQRFSKLAARLRRRLGTFQVEVRTGKQPKRPTFGVVTGRLIHRHSADLVQALGQVGRPENATEAHAARIRAKRLRYLLEPLSRRVIRARGLIDRLKELQDMLGDLHDMQVLGQEIADSIAVFSQSRTDRPAGVVPGLLVLQRLADEQASASFGSFVADWANGRAARFFARIEELGKILEQPEVASVPAKRVPAETQPAPAEQEGATSAPGTSLRSVPTLALAFAQAEK